LQDGIKSVAPTVSMDRFAGLRALPASTGAGQQPAYGMVTLQPRHIGVASGTGAVGIDGCELLINADTTGPTAAVAVELLDSMGFRVRGFGANGGRTRLSAGTRQFPSLVSTS
jgi:hypothetical protein